VAQQKPKKATKPRNYTVSGSSSSRSKSSAKGTKASRAKAPAARTTKTSKASAAKTTESKAAASRRKPAPNMQERMEGLQGWMAEIERKQGRMTYFGAAAAAVAIAASAGALYLGITTKDDAATKDDLDEIQTQLEATQQEVQSSINKGLKGTQDTIATLEQSVEDLKKKQAQDAEDIAALQSRPSSGQGGAGLGAGTGNNPGP
jgi:uncharacterized protein HemX